MRVESRPQYNPGEVTQVDESTAGRSQGASGRSQGTYRGLPRGEGITRDDVVEIVGEAVGEAMKQVIASISPEVKGRKWGMVLSVTSLISPGRTSPPCMGCTSEIASPSQSSGFKYSEFEE